jgi:hypothetical protein
MNREGISSVPISNKNSFDKKYSSNQNTGSHGQMRSILNFYPRQSALISVP